MYQIITVPEQIEESIETLGTKPKFWFKHNGISYLYKSGYGDSGEHWSEKIACELCNLLNLPHAHYELAVYKGVKGVICPDFMPEGGTLNFGNQLLIERVKDYPGTQFFRVKAHTLDLVLRILGSSSHRVQPPLGWKGPDGITKGVEVFVGYLMLDAWIGNQDRHHHNWGLIWTKEKTNHLAPSYDHGSSLGRNETDKNRFHILNHRGRPGRPLLIQEYVEKARSAFYSTNSSIRLKTTEAFKRAAEKYKNAGKLWLNRLERVSDEDVDLILKSIPETEMTQLAIEFTRKLLNLNKERLLRIGTQVL